MKQVLFISAVLLASACGSTGVSPTEAKPAAVSQPLFSTLYSNIKDPLRIVIHDEESWSALWAQMVAAGVAPAEAPQIDFAREDVVVAAMGERRAAGYEITIRGVQETADGLHVDVASKSPSPLCDRSEVITTPLHAVRISKTNEAVHFDEATVVLGCN